MYRETGGVNAEYTDVLELDLDSIVPCIAGPKRPQDRITLDRACADIESLIQTMRSEDSDSGQPATVNHEGQEFEVTDGAVVIAAITSCTNTSNPDVIMGAGLLAKNAIAKGLKVKPWVKTSLAPGSQVVTEYLRNSNLLEPLEQLGFDVVGYGCTTCIGNSGPLPEHISKAVNENNLIATSVLSGNRNFEGRVHAEVKMNFLASPPLVVAYALAVEQILICTTSLLGRMNLVTTFISKTSGLLKKTLMRSSHPPFPEKCFSLNIPMFSRGMKIGPKSNLPSQPLSVAR